MEVAKVLLETMSHDELRQIIAQLDQAIYNHQQWYNALIRTLVCRLPGDENDNNPESFKKCRFGQWYYGPTSEKLRNHLGFTAIGIAHQQMHELVIRLLKAVDMDNTISTLEFDSFANALEHLRLEIFSLKNELETLLYNRDPLTMTTNRVNMLSMLREQQAFVMRKGYPCSVLMIDLDHFKKINDDYGHAVGDKVLSVLAQVIIKNLRTYDKVFRYGGEEFLIYLPQTELPQGFEIAERLRQEISQKAIGIDKQKEVYVTVSIGVTLLDPNSLVETSIDHADKAMYLAKSEGRNCTKIWSM